MIDAPVQLPSAEKLIAAFVMLRDKRAEIKRAFEVQDDAIKATQEKVERALSMHMEQAGTTQLSGAQGTAYREVQRKFSCADWSTFWPWIKENDRFDMMQKRVGEKAVAEYLEETGELPPAINVFQEYKITIRRK